MLGIDTNVLVRFLTRDEPGQYERARRIIRQGASDPDGIYINQLVLLETEWVLRSAYGLSKAEIVAAISALLDAHELVFEDEPAIEEALFSWKKSNADLADCLIGAKNRRAGCRATATFDAKAAKVPGFVSA
ncbi:MAG: type II toxin-antitoxin system VapC family toxin [Rhodocyclales bacterium]|nr:type II toxin-antitoxin system VapC family toxin [Rhodocyclales bacterium]